LVNQYFATHCDLEMESRQIEEFRAKGEVLIHSEISFFVYKHDLKQSQISRMAGVNQAYISKFLRGEFFDLSENGKSLIYKWFLRFSKMPQIYLQSHNIVLTTSSSDKLLQNSSTLSPPVLISKNKNIQNNNFVNENNNNNSSITAQNTATKRTRFSFKSDHLVILEKCFCDNQYPDQKKREELAKLCNEARLCPDREKVTEQIITHWFQNKRKITRKLFTDEQQHNKSISRNFKTENDSSKHKASDYREFLQDAQIAAFKSIMDRNSSPSNKSDNEDQDLDEEEEDEADHEQEQELEESLHSDQDFV
jgi:predicted XRE-type DNA-binding protein